MTKVNLLIFSVQRKIEDCSLLNANMECMNMNHILADHIGTIDGVEITSKIEECQDVAIRMSGGICFDVRYELKGRDGKKFQLGAKFMCK